MEAASVERRSSSDGEKRIPKLMGMQEAGHVHSQSTCRLQSLEMTDRALNGPP